LRRKNDRKDKRSEEKNAKKFGSSIRFIYLCTRNQEIA